ncbi:MAG: DUF4270 domain-containing protein [Candidatus Amulumruptor caecigallinarius]|nr:DUF4270 domain-containing protein [Candidatus Amulumruptor caecigallinarius]
MKLKRLAGAALGSLLLFASCQDDVSEIGSSLSTGEVSIVVDSLVTDVKSKSIYYDSFDSRTINKLIGRINVPEYGSLSCSFVTQVMSAARMTVPDSITVEDVDSMRLVFTVPRGSFTGDSLAPQQLKVYRLEKQLPSDITSSFNPSGYYSSSSLMGKKSYSLSNIAKGDSAMTKATSIRIPVDMPLEFAKDIFTRYRANDPIFEWPATFNQYFPGIYVEQNFGNGCIANITKSEFFTYWHRTDYKSVMQPDSTWKTEKVVVRDSVCLLASQPEVLSSNIIDYKISDNITNLVNSGDMVITSPGGYMVQVEFPAKKLLEEYHHNGDALSMVSALRFEIPATMIRNEHSIGVAPYLLMIRSSEVDDFFAQNRVPDGITSFYAAYNKDTGSYQFNSMRDYFLKLLEDEKNGESIEGEDMEFILVPVQVTTDTNTGYNGVVSVYVTRCAPYVAAPTMTRLHTDRAVICFTYSSQQIR